jgi:hypothetical protein
MRMLCSRGFLDKIVFRTRGRPSSINDTVYLMRKFGSEDTPVRRRGSDDLKDGRPFSSRADLQDAANNQGFFRRAFIHPPWIGTGPLLSCVFSRSIPATLAATKRVEGICSFVRRSAKFSEPHDFRGGATVIKLTGRDFVESALLGAVGDFAGAGRVDNRPGRAWTNRVAGRHHRP